MENRRCNGTILNGKGANNLHWKGGVNEYRGYRFVYMPEHPYAVQNYVREHRLVMEQHLGRYLTPEERVHHIDGNKLNNTISNLRLFSNNIEHTKYEGQLKFGENKSTYLQRYMPNHPRTSSSGCVHEHILVMESILGRYLAKGEVVHHINGNKRDNTPSNLILFSSESEHRKHHQELVRLKKREAHNAC